ncbi:MAG: hypothetical protein RL755_1446, partial [Pseudomonadota bacterium]
EGAAFIGKNVFIGEGIRKQDMILNEVIGMANKIPVIFISEFAVENAAEIHEKLFHVLPWPAKHTQLIPLLAKLPIHNTSLSNKSANTPSTVVLNAVDNPAILSTVATVARFPLNSLKVNYLAMKRVLSQVL